MDRDWHGRIAPELADLLTRPLTPADLLELRMGARIGRDELHRLVGVHRTTAARWHAGATRVPPAVVGLLWVLGGGIPWPGWDGWRVQDGGLVPPWAPRRPFTAGHLAGVHWQYQLVGALRRELEAERQARADCGVKTARR